MNLNRPLQKACIQFFLPNTMTNRFIAKPFAHDLRITRI